MKRFTFIVGILSITLLAIPIFGVVADAVYDAGLSFTEQSKATETVAKPAGMKPREITPLTVENLLERINAERAKYGVQPLVIDERLNQSAQVKADDMRNRDYREHVDPDGKQGYEYAFEMASDACGSYASENYVWSKDGSTFNGLETSIGSWNHSKPHHDAIIDSKYVYTGFGINGDIVVEHFCQP